MAEVDWEVLWWMLWIGAAGACVGSFANMLIYRLPRERSLLRPLHSYCPECETPIRWYDNLPLISYLLLGGRCRHCRHTIPLRYPLIEGLCALGFMLIVDAFYVGAVRPDLQAPTAFGVTGQVAAGWPLLVGHLVMVAALLAIAAMDLEEYYVDVRLTWSIAVVGLAAGLTNGLGGAAPPPMSLTTAGATIAVAAGLALSWTIVQLWSRRRDHPAHDETLSKAHVIDPDVEPAPPEPPLQRAAVGESNETESGDAGLAEGAPQEVPGEPGPVWGYAVAILFAGLIAAWAACASVGATDRAAWLPAPARLALASAILFTCLLGASIHARPADTEIVQAIESERSQARRLAFGELLFLLPALALGAAAWWWLARDGGERAARALAAALAWPGTGSWQPLGGLLSAVLGMLAAGGIGWTVRIVFTLVLGKEALGLGDVHIMWAAGAVAGWAVVALGFFAGAFLALVGMILLLGFKRSRAIPFGPWLALGVLVVVLGREPIISRLRPATEALQELLTRAAH